MVVVDFRLLDADEEGDQSVRGKEEVEGEPAPAQSGPLQQSGTDEQHLKRIGHSNKAAKMDSTVGIPKEF